MLLEVLRLSQKLAQQPPHRDGLRLRIGHLLQGHAKIYGEYGLSRYTTTLIDDATQHKGWVLDVESLGEISRTDLEAGLACMKTYLVESWQIAHLYQRATVSEVAPINFGAQIIGGVTLARFMRFDPQLVLVHPALNSYSELGRTDFYEMMGSLTHLLAPLSAV
jgi:hypothetical protein